MNWYSIFYWFTVADGVKSIFDAVQRFLDNTNGSSVIYSSTDDLSF